MCVCYVNKSKPVTFHINILQSSWTNKVSFSPPMFIQNNVKGLLVDQKKRSIEICFNTEPYDEV